MKINKSLKISPSSILVFFKCSMQYKWNFIEERTPDPGSDNLYAVLGSTLHKASELNDLYYIPLDELKKSWKILFLNYLSDTKNLSEDTQHERFLSRGYDLLTNLFELKNRWKDKSKILKVEKYCKFEYKNKFIENVFLIGKIDVILKNLSDIVYTALDWKSSKSTKTQKEANKDLQLSFYIYFIHMLYKIDYEKILVL